MEHAQQPTPPASQTTSLGGAILDDEALHEFLQHAVQLATEIISSASSASITVFSGDGYGTTNSSSRTALAVDEAQYEADDGPCLQALRSSQQVQVRVADAVGRWPGFAAKADEMGVTKVVSSPLFRTRNGEVQESLAALNVYAEGEGPFDDTDLRRAQLIATQASMALAKAIALVGATQLNEQLLQAVASREVIGEAKGILMEREGCSRDEAFNILRRASQRQNRKLRDLAEELVMRVEARGAQSRGNS